MCKLWGSVAPNGRRSEERRVGKDGRAGRVTYNCTTRYENYVALNNAHSRDDLGGCLLLHCMVGFFFSSRRRHTRSLRDWSSDVCSSDLILKSKRSPAW